MDYMQEINKRIPPHDVEAEQSVVGSILQKQECYSLVSAIISAGDFYKPAHQIIYKAISQVYSIPDNIDIITVANQLKINQELDQVGGPSYLASLMDGVPILSHAESYAKIVKKHSSLRSFIILAGGISDKCYEGYGNPEESLNRIDQMMFEEKIQRKNRGFVKIGDLVEDCFKNIEDKSNGVINESCVATKYSGLDTILGGLQNTDLIIMASRPAMGKTTLAMCIAENVAIEQNIPVGVFSLEMGKNQLCSRVISSRSRVDSYRMRSGKLRDSDWPKLTNTAGVIANAPIFIDDTPGISIAELRSKARSLKADHDVKLIIVDYLQLIHGTDKRKNRTNEIGEITRSLKELAKELDLPVLALSQLNRSLETRTDKRPMLSDLRESGDIEQDADVVLFIYRDEVYNKSEDNPKKGIAEIIVGKQRNGPVGTVELLFIGSCTRFDNLITMHERV